MNAPRFFTAPGFAPGLGFAQAPKRASCHNHFFVWGSQLRILPPRLRRIVEIYNWVLFTVKCLLVGRRVSNCYQLQREFLLLELKVIAYSSTQRISWSNIMQPFARCHASLFSIVNAYFQRYTCTHSTAPKVSLLGFSSSYLVQTFARCHTRLFYRGYLLSTLRMSAFNGTQCTSYHFSCLYSSNPVQPFARCRTSRRTLRSEFQHQRSSLLNRREKCRTDWTSVGAVRP